MIRTVRILILFAMGSLLIPTVALAKKPSVTHTSSERTGTDQLIRLQASPKPDEVVSKIVCSPEMTRVRLDGIFPGKGDIEVIPVRQKGPVTFARLISRGAKGSVVQLYAGRRNMSVCARTNVSHLGGEIIISTNLTDSEIARFNKHKQSADSIRRVIITENAVEAPSTTNVISESAPETKQNLKAQVVAKTAAANGGKKRSTQSSKKPFGDEKQQDQESLTGIRYAAGFGFAAVIGGIAIYMLRRKKQIAGPDSGIEIISTKRIGPRQQLALASVQGKNFLLAVNDKTISTLGELPAPKPTETTSFQNTALLNRFAEEMNRQTPEPAFIEPAVAPAPKRPISQGIGTDPTEPMLSQTARFAFGKELRKELSTPSVPNIPQPEVEQSAPVSSNVAGLIAMARSKATFEKQAKKPQRVEA